MDLRIIQINRGAPDSALFDRNLAKISTALCFQCNKCTSGCPVSYEMDITPTQLVHAVQLGLFDLVLNSKTIWLCASCQTCTTRCPQDVDIAGLMDILRAVALNKNIKAKVPDVSAFYKSSIGNINFFGRMYELGLILTLKILTRHYLKDMKLGIKMLKKGKLNVFPSFGGTLAARKIFAQIKAVESSNK